MIHILLVAKKNILRKESPVKVLVTFMLTSYKQKKTCAMTFDITMSQLLSTNLHDTKRVNILVVRQEERYTYNIFPQQKKPQRQCTYIASNFCSGKRCEKASTFN